MSSSVQGKVVIITGSSMGIGKALAINLGKAGAKIIINGRNNEKLQETLQELKQLGIEAAACAGDITNPSHAAALINSATATFGGIDILVNNAGTSMRGAIAKTSDEVVKDIYAINTIAPITLTRLALDEIRKRRGSIIFISSLAGLRGLPLISIYCSAKMALTSIVESLRVEHSQEKIHFGIVYVGITEVEQGKKTIGPNGELILLEERTGWHVASLETVAKKIARNITHRKRKTIIGIVGKTYYFLNRLCPWLMEFLTINSFKRQQKLYQ